MKTPKLGQDKKNATPAGGKITKNKAKGKNHLLEKLDAAKAKMGLQKAKDTVKVQDGKKLQKKTDMKNKVFNGKGTPAALNGSAVPNAKGGKKRKSDEGTKPDVVDNKTKSKKSKGAGKSPEVQLGLKIEKMLESPPNDKPGKKKNRRKGKGAANAGQKTPEVSTPVAESPAQGKKKKKGKGLKAEGVSPVSVKPAEKQQKEKQQAAPKPKIDKPEWDTPVPLGPFPSRPNAENAIKALLKHIKEHKAKKPVLLDEFEPLLVCVDFFKHPQCKRLQRTVLPNQLLGNNPDIIFVVTDSKKAKKDHDESIDAHKELFSSRGVNNISEIIPWRKLCYEYTQFEEKRKLANRADAFLIDSKLSHRWPAVMRKKFFRNKAPIPVRVDKTSDLKKSIEIALRKIAIIVGPNSLSVSPQFGHTKMNLKSLVDNLITVITVLCDPTKFPSGQANIRRINVRGAKSESFPIYISTASPNSVEITKPQKKKREIVEGEVTTAGVTVAVHPGGRIQIKSKDKDDDEVERNVSPKKKPVKGKVDSDEDVDDDDEDEDDDDDDSEIDSALLEKFKRANRASEDESTDEEEIDKAEQEFLLQLRKQQDALEAEALAKNKKAGKKVPVVMEGSSDDEDEDDEDLDDEEDDDSDVPDLIPAKKSKPQAPQPKKGKNAKQSAGPAQNGLGKGKPGKGKPGKQAPQSPKGKAGKKGPQGGKGNTNQKGNNKGSPKPQQRFNKGGKKK